MEKAKKLAKDRGFFLPYIDTLRGVFFGWSVSGGM